MKERFDLFKLSHCQLKAKESKKVTGGNCCACGCAYTNCGGSSVAANMDKNMEGDKISPHFTAQC